MQALLAESAKALGVSDDIPVLASPVVRMPLAWGILRPVILLPADALRWSDERVRVVLLHEMAHLRRHDYGTSLLSELICIIYWPSPLVWIARRHLRVEQERACDDRVLALGTPAVAYADHILAIARDFYGSRWDLEMVVAMAREVSLKQRVRAILDDSTDRRSTMSRRGLALIVAALGVYLPLGAVRASTEAPVTQVADLPKVVTLAPVGQPGSERPVYLWVEAEMGAAGAGAFPGGDLDASHAQYVMLDPAGSQTASLRVETSLAVAGEYFVWARAATGKARPWTLGLTIEGGGVRWSGAVEGDGDEAVDEWRWFLVQGRPTDGSASPSGAFLPAGRQRLELVSTDDRVRVDRILVTTDAAFVPEAKGPGASERPAYLLVEGEDGSRKGRIRGGEDAHSSGGGYVVFREGTRAEADGTVEYNFDIPQAGRYLIWGRTFAKDEESNSFHVSFNGAAELIWDVPASDGKDTEPRWTWGPLSARADRDMDPLPLDMVAGPQTLRIRAREGGAHLDALLVTNDLDRRPDGLWPEAIPTRPARLELSAASALLSGPIAMTRSGDGRPYIVVDEVGRAREPGPSGLAAFEFEAAETGLYSIWARTVAPSTDQDSFWIRVNGGEWILWNGIPQSSDWSWAPVRDADAEGRLLQLRLDPGRHTLEIAGREGGLRLDRLLVTNDPLFTPS